MNNEYIMKIESNKEREKRKTNYIFGALLGNILMYLGIITFLQFKWYDNRNVYSYITFGIGALLVSLVTISPNILDKPFRCIRWIGSNVGKLILNIILTIIYFVLVFPIGLVFKNKDKNEINKNTAFKKYSALKMTKQKKGLLKVLQVFKIFANERYFLMIPFIVIILLLGLFLFFAQSSIVAPFIYTLF